MILRCGFCLCQASRPECTQGAGQMSNALFLVSTLSETKGRGHQVPPAPLRPLIFVWIPQWYMPRLTGSCKLSSRVNKAIEALLWKLLFVLLQQEGTLGPSSQPLPLVDVACCWKRHNPEAPSNGFSRPCVPLLGC